MYIFIKWTYLFRNIWIKIVFLLRRDPYAASPGPSQWVFFLRCLGSSCQCCKHDLILQPHQKSPPRLESTSEDTNSPHFRCRFISGTFFWPPALPTFATAFGRLLRLIFKSPPGLKQFLHSLVDKITSYPLLPVTATDRPVPIQPWSRNSLEIWSWSSFFAPLAPQLFLWLTPMLWPFSFSPVGCRIPDTVAPRTLGLGSAVGTKMGRFFCSCWAVACGYALLDAVRPKPRWRYESSPRE